LGSPPTAVAQGPASAAAGSIAIGHWVEAGVGRALRRAHALAVGGSLRAAAAEYVKAPTPRQHRRSCRKSHDGRALQAGGRATASHRILVPFRSHFRPLVVARASSLKFIHISSSSLRGCRPHWLEFGPARHNTSHPAGRRACGSGGRRVSPGPCRMQRRSDRIGLR